MRKILAVFLVLILAFSCNANAIYFFEPKAIERESGNGVGTLKLSESKDVMKPAADTKTFEETVFEGWEEFEEEIDVSEFEIPKDELEQMYIELLLNNPMYCYVDCNYQYSYDENDDGTYYVTAIEPQYITTNIGEIENMRNATFEETVLKGWDSFAEIIPVRKFKITVDEMEKRYNEVLYNNPLYYYVGRDLQYYYIEYGEDSVKYVESIIVKYTTTDTEEIAAMHKGIEEEIDNILLYIENDMTDFEKVVTVHDYMVIHYDYDDTLENHTISIMVTKTGVCESYTFAFMHVMKLLGIESRYVSSDAMKHAWNLVKINGKWYHIDLTWDDTGRADQTWHKFQLLSDKKIQSLDKPHVGYDTGGIVADSELYDDATWHENHSQIVALRGTDYWVDGNTLVSSKGDMICPTLDGGDNLWSIGDGVGLTESNYTGLAVFGGKLYYNTDKGIFVYNPITKKSIQLKEIDGVCGLHIDGNILKYAKCGKIIEDNNVTLGDFYEVDETIKLSGARITVPFIKNGKAIAKIYNDGSEKINIMSFGKNGIEMVKAKEGVTSVEFDVNDFNYIYFMDDKLNPLHDKVRISE